MQLCCIIILQLSCVMKRSKKREKILDLFRNGSLLTASEVCEKLTDIDRATIYRNLDLFLKEGILRKVNVKEGIASYELNIDGDYHQHFLCTNCEKIIPVVVDLKVIEQYVPSGVKFENFELNFKGKCEECKNN